jgi:hypothetical protein
MLVDYLPRFPIFQLNRFQEVLLLAFFGVSFSWAAVSTVVVLARGGSLFSDDPECSTLLKLTRKYSPPFWQKVTFWTVRLEIVLFISFLISLFVWHERRVG